MKCSAFKCMKEEVLGSIKKLEESALKFSVELKERSKQFLDDLSSTKDILIKAK